MKKIIFFALVFLGVLAIKQANAQVSFNLNISAQPLWGPVGYEHVDYYYLPDIDCYYDVPHHQFIYPEGKTWKRSATVPDKYKNYDLYKGYKVVVNQPVPYLDDRYRKSYAKYKKQKSEPVIRDSHDRKYKRPGVPPVPQPAHPAPGHPKPGQRH